MKVTLPESGEEIILSSTPELTSDLAAWRETDCKDHEKTEWRRRLTAGGGFQTRRQCLNCGHILGQSRKRQDDDELLKEADMAARDAYDANRHHAYDEILENHARRQRDKETSWFKEHNEYLNSTVWKEKRKLVLKRAAGTCEGCGVSPPVEVHHRTYENWKSEFLFELVAVCNECHKRLHLPMTSSVKAFDDGPEDDADGDDPF
jgi:hypothetical protein